MRCSLLITTLPLALALAFVPVAVGQDEPARRSPEESRFGDGTRLAERLEQRLEELEKEEAQLRDAIERLRAGEAPGPIMMQLREHLRQDGGDDRGDGPGWRGRDDRHSGERMSPEQFIDFVRERRPKFGERLAAIRAMDPERFDREFVEHAERWRSWLQDPERMDERLNFLETEVEIREAARIAHTATGEERDEAVEKIRSLVAQQFDQRRTHAVERLEQSQRYVEKLAASIEQVDAKREEFIQRRVDEIIARAGEPEGRDGFRRGRPDEARERRSPRDDARGDRTPPGPPGEREPERH